MYFFLAQKDRGLQTSVTSKEKGIQTSSDDTLIKQLDLKDKKISELERSLLKAKKQIEKNSKLEKEVADLKAQNLRQAKELESEKRTKKKYKVRLSEF